MASILDGLSPEDAAWVSQELEQAPKDELEELMRQDEILKMLAQPDIQDYGSYKYGEAVIRHKKFMSKKLRRLLASSDRKVKTSEDPLSTQDDAVYSALAEICVDAPWNNPNSWKLVDLKTNDGRVYKIFKDLVNLIATGEQQTKTFQHK